MNFDQFEQNLQQQPLRQIPREWRAEVLSKARSALHGTDAQSSFNAFVFKLGSQFSALLWPSPKAWVSLGAIWLLLLMVNTFTHDTSSITPEISRPARESILAWREQERLLRELLAPDEIRVADKPKSVVPQPRSARHNTFLIV
jgi:hypothetical protein